MDQRALWLGSTFAAAKLAMALWAAQLALSSLDRRRATLNWQIALALLGMGAAWWTMRAAGVQSWWRGAWLADGIIAAAALVECLRRWLAGAAVATAEESAANGPSVPSPESAGGTPPADADADADAAKAELLARAQARAKPEPVSGSESWRIHRLIASLGLAVSLVTTAMAVVAQMPADWLLRGAALLTLVSSAGLLGIATAASLELTLGPLGEGLLQLRWKALARWATIYWMVQLGLGALIALGARATESPLETAAPFLFAFGMMVVGYIAWSIPRQMVVFAGRGAVQGQSSLAVAGWLSVICLAIASLLPPAWPWNQLDKQALARFSPLAIVEQ